MSVFFFFFFTDKYGDSGYNTETINTTNKHDSVMTILLLVMRQS